MTKRKYKKSNESCTVSNIEYDVNRAMDESVFVQNGVCKPYVCVVCNKYLMRHEVFYIEKKFLESHSDLLIGNEELPNIVRQFYKYVGPGTSKRLQKLLLSSNAVFLPGSNKFVSCKLCSKEIKAKVTPKFAISNGFAFGPVPRQIKELTDIELALITPCRVHVHVLTFLGGHKGLKGFHSLVKTNLKRTVGALKTMESYEDFPEKVYVLTTGHMTPSQMKRVKERCQIDRRKCLNAIKWLLTNNKLYAEMTTDNFEFKEPLIIEEHVEVESIDTNLERREEFNIVFPDGTLEESRGGCETTDDFKRKLEQILKSANVKAEIQVPRGEFVKETNEKSFTVAFPRQFPYGFGGPDEQRKIRNGSRGRIGVEEYFKHIVDVAEKRFQESLFILVSFNQYFRQKIAQRAFWKINVSNEQQLASTTIEDLQRVFGSKDVSVFSEKAGELKRMVSVLSQTLPHTNEAAKVARGNLLSMHCAFGPPDIFFTTSPAEDNSFLIQVYSWQNNSCKSVENLTLEEMKSRMNLRSETVFQYPGYSVLNFEQIMHIVRKKVLFLGCEHEGIFGKVAHYFESVEEQGRKALHSHFLLWIDGGVPGKHLT